MLLGLTFVLIWSTGFLVARLAMPHADALTFLVYRFALTLAVMLPLALVMRAPWPARGDIWRLGIAGLLLQLGYLGGVWAAAKAGMPAGILALIMGLQPLITGLLSGPLIGERVSPLQWLGLLLGLAGVSLVLAERLLGSVANLPSLSTESLLLAAIALISITAGTLWQRRECPTFDLRTGSVIQFVAATALGLPLALWLEPGQMTWNADVIMALSWSVVGISVGGMSLMFVLIRSGSATRFTSLLYLTPPTTAAMAWLLFDEPITLLMLAGTALTALAVWMVQGRTPTSKVVIEPARSS